MERVKVLVADDDGQFSIKAANFLREHGFECRKVKTTAELKKTLAEWGPRFIVADLTFPGMNAMEMVTFLRKNGLEEKHNTRVIVTSSHNDESNVRTAFRGGAVDYLVKPLDFDLLLRRLVFQFRRTHKLTAASPKKVAQLHPKNAKIASTKQPYFMMQLTEVLLRATSAEQDVRKSLFNLTKMVATKMDGVRCNIVNYKSQKDGQVLVSSDDENFKPMNIDLRKYPEIVSVVNTGQHMVLEDLGKSNEMKLIKSMFQSISFNSMIVCPIEFHGESFGVLSLRMPEERTSFAPDEVLFVQIATHVASLVLSEKTAQDWLKQSA